jgi:hypothetical protein
MIRKIALLKKTIPDTLWIIGGVIALAACASPTPARVAISTADEAVERAISADAAKSAPLALHLARDKLDHAKSSFAEKDYDIARRLAEEAHVEARLAESTALSARAQSQVEEVQKAIEDLRRESSGVR